MTVTGTMTVTDAVRHACRKAGMVAWDEEVPGDLMPFALMQLEVMLKGWQNVGYNLWTKTSGTLALTAEASYELNPVRPLRILSARLKRNGLEMPMDEMSRDEYDRLPDKSASGTPTQFYFDRQRESARLFVWPTLSAPNGETIEFTYEREVEDIGKPSAILDLPAEWWDAATSTLALEMLQAMSPGQVPVQLERQARQKLDAALAFDTEGSIYFAGPYAI